MSRNGLSPVGLDKLEAALDAYGADRTRWPAPLRLALSSLIASNPDAQKMLKDAEAFDRLLDMAPQYDTSRLGMLSDRIAASVERQPRLVSSSPGLARNAMDKWSGLHRHRGMAATALAASLVLGVFAGQLRVFNSTADVLLGGNATAGVTRQLALSDDADGFLEEDML